MADRDSYAQDLLDRYYPPRVEPRLWENVLSDAFPKKATRRRWRLTAVPFAAAFAAIGVLTVGHSNDQATLFERAAAAIAPPAASQVLFENLTLHPGPPGVAVRVRLWLEGATPHRFRVISQNHPKTSLFSQPELDGSLGTTHGPGYGPTDHMPDAVRPIEPFREINLNPVAFLRTALIHHDRWTTISQAGAATVNGRTVTRIIVAYQPPGHARTTVNYFIDAHTFQPVRVVINDKGLAVAPTSILALSTGYLEDPANLVYDFSGFRYLPATQENIDLTDLPTTHPPASRA